MNGVHDMGGMDGFGKVEPEPNEPTFHEKWEGRVMAMVRAMGAAGAFNIDTSRFYREALPPHIYLASSYYRKWLLGLEDNLVAKGFVNVSELETGHANAPAQSLKRGKFNLKAVERVMTRGSFERTPQSTARFKPGDRTDKKHSSRDAYASPPLHTRPCRRGRAHPGLSGFPGFCGDGTG